MRTHTKFKKINLENSAAPVYRHSEQSVKSSAEFGRGSSAAALLKQAFSPLIFPNAGPDLYNRLSEKLRKIIRTGPSSLKGLRTVKDGDLALLRDFQLSCYTAFKTIANVPLHISVDAKGQLQLAIPAFIIAASLRKAPKAELAVFRIIAGTFNFNEKTYSINQADDLLINMDDTHFRGAEVQLPFKGSGETILIAGIAVFFAKKHGTEFTVLLNRKYIAGQILEASYIRDGKIVDFENAEPAAVKPAPVKFIQTGKISWNLNTPVNPDQPASQTT